MLCLGKHRKLAYMSFSNCLSQFGRHLYYVWLVSYMRPRCGVLVYGMAFPLTYLSCLCIVAVVVVIPHEGVGSYYFLHAGGACFTDYLHLLDI